VTDRESRCILYKHHKVVSILSAVREDIVRFATFSPYYRPEINFKTQLSIFFKPAILCLLCYRIGHYLHVRRWRRLAHAVSRFNLLMHKANIPPQSCIGPGFFLGHCPASSFHGAAGRNLTMFSLAVCCPRDDSHEGPWLGDDVTIGGHAVVIGSITIGDNVKIAPLTRLDVDCPGDTLVASARMHPKLRLFQPASGQLAADYNIPESSRQHQSD
jgi:serine O-acetyltransferase